MIKHRSLRVDRPTCSSAEWISPAIEAREDQPNRIDISEAILFISSLCCNRDCICWNSRSFPDREAKRELFCGVDGESAGEFLRVGVFGLDEGVRFFPGDFGGTLRTGDCFFIAISQSFPLPKKDSYNCSHERCWRDALISEPIIVERMRTCKCLSLRRCSGSSTITIADIPHNF